MKAEWKKLLICIAIPLAVGLVSGWLTRDSMQTFSEMNQPPLSPPGWLFPIVWTILYILMGIASYLVVRKGAENAEKAIMLYIAQLAFNFCWSLIFFNLEWYLFAFLWLLVLWGLILATIFAFREISRAAALLMIPYLVWVTFAGYLNFGIYLLN